jgi:hypothetical protein
MCLPKIPVPAKPPLLLIAKSHGIQVTSNNETDNNFYTPYIQPILSPGDYLRPTTTSFLQMANICRLLKCKNPISEAYNFGFSQLLFVGLCGPENEKNAEAPPARKQKMLSNSGLLGHRLHRAQVAPHYLYQIIYLKFKEKMVFLGFFLSLRIAL